MVILAQLRSSDVTHGSIIGRMQFASGIGTISFLINNKTVRVSERMYQIYAVMICGLNSDAVFIHIFEQGLLNAFGDF